MILISKSKSFSIPNLRELDKSTSSLLVPEHLIPALKAKIRENGNSLPIYFLYLLKRFRILSLSNLIPPPRKLKTEYQEEGLNLQKVNFRVSNAAWIEIGELSLAFGKSRCALFVYLLELDLAGLGDILFEMDLGVPTTEKFLFRASWSIEHVSQDFERSYHIRR